MLRKANLVDDGVMLIILVPLAVAAVWSAWRTAVLVHAGGQGDVPPPRSHDHEWVAPWRV